MEILPDRLILDYILTHYAMFAIWTMVMASTIVVGIRTDVYEIMVTGAGVIPLIIYYTYRILGIDLPIHHAAYHRIALGVLAISLLLTLWMVHRRVYRGET